MWALMGVDKFRIHAQQCKNQKNNITSVEQRRTDVNSTEKKNTRTHVGRICLPGQIWTCPEQTHRDATEHPPQTSAMKEFDINTDFQTKHKSKDVKKDLT